VIASFFLFLSPPLQHLSLVSLLCLLRLPSIRHLCFSLLLIEQLIAKNFFLKFLNFSWAFRNTYIHGIVKLKKYFNRPLLKKAFSISLKMNFFNFLWAFWYGFIYRLVNSHKYFNRSFLKMVLLIFEEKCFFNGHFLTALI